MGTLEIVRRENSAETRESPVRGHFGYARELVIDLDLLRGIYSIRFSIMYKRVI